MGLFWRRQEPGSHCCLLQNHCANSDMGSSISGFDFMYLCGSFQLPDSLWYWNYPVS